MNRAKYGPGSVGTPPQEKSGEKPGEVGKFFLVFPCAPYRQLAVNLYGRHWAAYGKPPDQPVHGDPHSAGVLPPCPKGGSGNPILWLTLQVTSELTEADGGKSRKFWFKSSARVSALG